MTPEAFLSGSATIGLVLILVAIAIATIRVWRGPLLADRIVAVDLMTASIISFCAMFAVWTGKAAYLDIALALSVVSFLSVVAFARSAQRAIDEGKSDD